MNRYLPELSLLSCLAASTCLAAVPEAVTLKGHRGSVLAVAFSTDGKLLASGGGFSPEEKQEGYPRGEVILWDVATGEKQRVLFGHPGQVTCLAFNPDGKILASGGCRQYSLKAYDTEENLKLWDVASGRALATFLGQGDQVICLAFSPDGNTLASGGIDGTVKLRLADRDWKVRATLKPPTSKTREEAVTGMAFDPQGLWLATGVSGGSIEIWDMTNLRMKNKLRVHNVKKHGCFVALAPDGKTLATGASDGVVQLWDTESFQIRRTFKAHPKTWAMAFSPNGKMLATAAGEWHTSGSAVLWDVSAGTRIAVLEGHEKGVTALAFSSDGRLLASGSYDETVKLWSLGDLMEGESDK